MTDTPTPVRAPDYATSLAAAGADAASQARALYHALRDAPPETLESAHAPDGHGAEHALLAAAIAYCLGYELRAAGAPVDPDALRLAALAHDLDLDETIRDRLVAPVPRWLARRDLFFDALPGSPFPVSYFNSPAEQALYAAHLVAALPLPVPPTRPAADAFNTHPLGRAHGLPAVALVASSVTRAEEYVFESPRLPEIRGAGEILDRLNRVDLPALFGAEFDTPDDQARAEAVRAWFAARADGARLDAPECVLHAGGGHLLALAPASLAAPLRDAVEALYAEATLVAACVAAARPTELLELQYGRQPTRFWWREYEATRADEAVRALLAGSPALEAPQPGSSFPPGKGFGELGTDLALARARRRDERALYPNWTAPAYARPCASCDRRAAALAPGDDALCLPCWRKRQAGQALEGAWIRRFVHYLETAGSDTPYARQRPPGGWEAVGRPADLDAIAAASTPTGYLGLIYADGDGVGAQLAAQQTPAAYRALSRALLAASEHAVLTALARHLRAVGRGTDWKHPFEVLAVGGDDVLLLVPGSVALALAATLGRTWEAAFPTPAPAAAGDPWAGQRYRPPRDGAVAGAPPQPAALSLSAGVVIAHTATPLALLRDMAGQLLKSAKRKRRAAPDLPTHGGCCDFLVLRAADLPAVRLEDLRASETRQQGRSELRLGAAPYTWVELQGLLATARAVHDARFPRAQLHAVRDLLARDEAAASVDYLYYRARLDPRDRRAAAAYLERAWSGTPDEGPRGTAAPPWRWLPPRDGWERRETILPDLLALQDFCAESLDEGDAHAAD